MSVLGGNAWSALRGHSLEVLHSMFVEVDEDGKPSLTFRPWWFKLNSTGYPKASKFIDSMIDVWNEGNQLTLNAIDIFDFNLGRNTHNLYSFFATLTMQSDYGAQDNISELQYPSKANRRFPYAAINQTARSGFFPCITELNTLAQLGLNLDGRSDQGGLLEINEIVYSMFRPSFWMQDGTMEIVGNSKIKIGRVLKLGSDVPLNAEKLFLIEGYSDKFSVEENGVATWTQSLKLSHGATISAYQEAMGQNVEPAQVFANKRAKFLQQTSFTKK